MILWQHSYEGGALFDSPYDTTNFDGMRFPNSAVGLNDEASSTKNCIANIRVCAYVHSGFTGASLLHLGRVQYAGSVAFAYVTLGSFNDEFTPFKKVGSSGCF